MPYLLESRFELHCDPTAATAVLFNVTPGPVPGYPQYDNWCNITLAFRTNASCVAADDS